MALSKSSLNEIKKIVGEKSLSTEKRDRIIYSRTVNTRNLIFTDSSIPNPYPPDAVLWPSSVNQVVSLVRYCKLHSIKLTPYGCGASGLQRSSKSEGEIMIDMKKLCEMSDPNPVTSTIKVQAGVKWSSLIKKLKSHGWSLPIKPTPPMCSTVGGWIASNPAFVSHGINRNPGEIVVKLQIVTPDGELREITETFAQESAELSMEFIKGMMGRAGIITSAELKILPAAERTTLLIYKFPSLKQAIESMHSIVQSGIAPELIEVHCPMSTIALESMLLKPQAGKFSIELTKKLKKFFLKETLPYFVRHPYIANSIMKNFGEELSYGVAMLIYFEGFSDVVENKINSLIPAIQRASGKQILDDMFINPEKIETVFQFFKNWLWSKSIMNHCVNLTCRWNKIHTIYHSILKLIKKDCLIISKFHSPTISHCHIQLSCLFYERSSWRKLTRFEEIINKINKTAIKNRLPVHGGDHQSLLNLIIDEPYRKSIQVREKIISKIDSKSIFNSPQNKLKY